MTHLFEKKDRWGNGAAFWVVAAMVFLIPLAWWSVRQIDLENDVRNWLPSNDPQAKAFKWYEGHFATDDRILVSWDGSSLTDPRVERLAKKLRGTASRDGVRRNGVKHVKEVLTPGDLIGHMTKYKVSRQDAIQRIQGILIGPGMMKVRLTDAGRQRIRHFKAELLQLSQSKLDLKLEIAEAAVAEEDADLFAEEDFDEDDETLNEDEEVLEEEDAFFASMPAHDFQVAWHGMHMNSKQVASVKELILGLRGPPSDKNPEGEQWVEECFFVPGTPVALSVSLSELGKAETVEAFQEIQIAAAAVGIPVEALHLGGRPVVGNALNQYVKKVGWNRDFAIYQLHRRSPLLLSAIVVTLLAFLMLKSFRLAALVILVANYTTLLTVALVPITNGSMNMVLVVMPTLLSVITISAAIHVANYWRYAAHRDMRTAIVEATKMAKQPCVLASVTTAIGLISLATSPLTPVRDFGLYSAVGCLISLVVVLIGFPALLQYWSPKRPVRIEIHRAPWRRFAGLVTRYQIPITAVCLVALAVGAYGLKWFRTETKVIHYFPSDSQVVRDYNFLEQNLAGIIPVETIVRFDEEAQQNLNFIDRMELVREIQNKMRQHPEISGTISLADFQPQIERPGKNARFLQKARYNKRANVLEKRVNSGEDSAASAFLAVADQSADLYEVGDGKLNQAGDQLWRITSQVAIMSEMNYGDLGHDLDAIAQSVLKYHPGAGHITTGMVPLFLRTQQAVLDSLVRSFALAFSVIAIVMIILLKNPLSGLLTMLPNLLPVGIVFGVISWCGAKIDIGSMITASVALGIAVDGTLHLLTWFRSGIMDGLSRREALARALAHCGPAMSQTTAAVGIGLFMLYPADLLLISRFGWLMGALIATALVADIIFLPALLAGPLGYLIERTIAAEAGTRAESAEYEPLLDAVEGTAALHAAPHLKIISASTETGQILRID